MKVIFPLALALGAHAAQLQLASQLENDPMTAASRVSSLLMEMRSRIQSDGIKEQMSYDKYACWCESVLGRKAGDISEGKKSSNLLQNKITSLVGEVASHGAEIKALESDIAANLESQRDARSVRDKQYSDYEGEKTESEQCIGALEAATKTLTGAGKGGKGGFLETMKEVQLLSVVSGVRGALKMPSASKSMSTSDLSLLHNFLEHPAAFVGKRAGNLMSASQIANNPFGDYAPQSTQIQGILRGMYEGFTHDLERSNGEEADAQKAFEALMATKKEELETLQSTLGNQQGDFSRKTLVKDTSNEQLDDTKAQLTADEAFFETTKAGCKEKAQQWSVRSGLRSQELTGVNMAISILTSDEAREIFRKSGTAFVQVAAHIHNAGAARLGASAKLADMAQRFGSLGLARVALDLKSGGKFDNVIVAVDSMIASLRQEEQEDIAHRDRCERATDKSTADTQDINDDILKAGTTVNRLGEQKKSVDAEILSLEGQIDGTKLEMKQALDLRNTAVIDFEKALKDDADAGGLLDQTIMVLVRFYEENRTPMSLSQKAPDYDVDADKAPTTSWADEKYGGRKDETHGVVEIIRMLKEDIEKEMKTSREDNAAAEAQYEKERAELQNTLDAQLALKDSNERQLGEVQGSINDKNKFKTAKETDLIAENGLRNAINSNCAWVANNFQSRRDKRKVEIDGLIDAKGYLAGALDGSLI